MHGAASYQGFLRQPLTIIIIIRRRPGYQVYWYEAIPSRILLQLSCTHVKFTIATSSLKSFTQAQPFLLHTCVLAGINTQVQLLILGGLFWGPERLKSYPTEPFTMSNKKLFCSGCWEELSLKKSAIELHIKSVKHTSGKERLAAKERQQTDIANALQQHDSEVHPSGETLPSSTRIYRVNVVTTLLKAGIPLSPKWIV